MGVTRKRDVVLTRFTATIPYTFLLMFHGNCGTILYHFQDKARHLSNITISGSAFDFLIRVVSAKLLP